MGKRIESTIPGLIYPPVRDTILRTSKDFLDGRRREDGAEGLWRVHDKLYDLEGWLKKHPGGAEWLELTKGTDITEAFETHHITHAAEKLLPKFYIRDAKSPKSTPFTFKPDGFYITFKGRVREALKDVNFHRPATKSNLIADSLATTFIIASLLAAKTQSWLVIIIAAILLSWTTVVGHNYFHMRDSFRMHYFDFSLMSSKDWRISHALSHHLYPNTIWDYEIFAFEPFLQWLPFRSKKMIQGYLAVLYSPFLYSVVYLVQGFKRYYTGIFQSGGLGFRDVVPFLIPLAMCLTARSLSTAIGTWLAILVLASFHFSFVGLNAAHHHPDIFHDGDYPREDLDWGLLTMDTVRGRVDIDKSAFLVLTNFGQHTLHHLLPTVDHSYLPLCMPVYKQTCEEFGLDFREFTQWKLVKGQFLQLIRNGPKKNSR